MTYAKQIKSPKWQKRRTEILNRDKFSCQLCHDEETELHVHHKYYTKGAEIWEYPDEALQTLCKHCHAAVERLKDVSDTFFKVQKVAEKYNATLLCVYYQDYDKGFSVSFIRFHDDEFDYLLGLKEDSLKNVLDNLERCKNKING